MRLPRRGKRLIRCTLRLRAGLLLALAALAQHAHAAADQAEIQINLCGDPAAVARALALGPAGNPVTVWLFDTAALDLASAGIRLRLRERGRQGELTLKVGGQDCARIDRAALGADGKCEADLHGASMEDVVSLTRTLDNRERATLLPAAGRSDVAAALTALLTPAQRQGLATQRAEPLPATLRPLGPTVVQRYRRSGAPYVVEVWRLPAGATFIELSQKLPRSQALAQRDQLLLQLRSASVDVCADQGSQAQRRLKELLSPPRAP